MVFYRLPDLSRVGVGDSDRRCGGGLPWAVDSLDGRFSGVRCEGVGGMGCRSFDVRVVCDEFAVGVGSLLHGHMWRGIGEHWVGVGLANLEWPEKISFLVLRGISIGVCVGGCMALLGRSGAGLRWRRFTGVGIRLVGRRGFMG